MNQEKLDILKDLVVDEEHNLEDLKRLVEKSKPFLKIENKTGKIIISPDFQFTISERIIVYLIGIYFSKELGLNQDVQITSRFISENIDIAQTSISGPLGDYVRKKIVSSDEDSYAIKYYEIENQLDFLKKKKEGIKNTPKNRTTAPRKKTKPKKNARKKLLQKIEKNIDEETLKNELRKYNLSRKDLSSVFNIANGHVILIRGWKGDSNTESQVKSTLLFLTANKLIYGLEEVNSSELRKCLLDVGVPMNSHSTTLKCYSTYVIHKTGPIGSTNTSYRITSLGFQKGIILFKDIIENTSNFDLKFKRKIKSDKAEEISVDEKKLNQNIPDFVKQHDLNKEVLRTLFDFQKDGIRMCIPLREKKRKIIQIKSLMLLGVLLKSVYNVNSFSGKNLLKYSKVSYDRLDLLDSNKHYKKYFSINKPKSAMQLTYAGEKKSIEMLKEYLEKEECQL